MQRFIFLMFLFWIGCVPISRSEPRGIQGASSELVSDRNSLSRVESRTRNAAVKISDLAGSGYGSGTYVRFEGHDVIFTAAHVVTGETQLKVSGRAGESVIGVPIYVNESRDFAILSVPQIHSRTPIVFRTSRQTRGELVGRSVTYSGFPGGYDLLTIRGAISGMELESEMLIMHSYAWMGASGSGVFDQRGNIVGILVAVDIGYFRVPQIVEDVVWVTPISEIDLDAVRSEILKINTDSSSEQSSPTAQSSEN